MNINPSRQRVMKPHPNVTIEDIFARTSPEPNSGCWIWTNGLSPKGYGQIHTDRKTQRAHRVAYALKTGQAIPKGMFVCHKCDVRCCVNPDHLFLGDNSDNVVDCIRKSRLPTVKLHIKQVKKIRPDTRPSSVIAAEFGVSKKTIDSIKTKRTWSFIE